MRVSFSIWLLAGLIAANGCSHFKRRGHHDEQAMIDRAAGVPLAAERASWDLDFGSYPNLEPRQLTPFTGPYRVLTEQQCQCIAASASSRGEMLDQEQALVAPAKGGRRGNKSRLQQDILRTSALEARNQDASNALELFYRLAEAEVKSDLLNQSIKHVEKAIDEGQRIKKQGLRVPPEFDDFERQHRDLQTERVKLDVGIEQLNGMLGKMLDFHDVPDKERIQPDIELVISPPGIETAAAIARGLETRPELQLLRDVRNGGPGTLDAMRKMLGSANALVGMSSSGPCAKLRAVLCANEAGVRQEQLDRRYEQRQREISNDIRQAALDMQGQVQIIAVARSRAHDAQTKLKEQQDKHTRGRASAIEVITAQLTLLKAQGELAHQVMAWYIARAKLKEAQGLLVTECQESGALETGHHH